MLYMQPPEIDLNKLDGILERHKSGRWQLIPLLQDVQETFGYVPPETIEPIAEALNLFPSQVQGVITFYSGFSLKPKGKYVCKVCRGTACHVKGAERILNEIESRFQLCPGQTSQDRKLTLETVACFGSCAIAPVVVVDNSVKGRMNPTKTRDTLEHLDQDANRPQVGDEENGE